VGLPVAVTATIDATAAGPIPVLVCFSGCSSQEIGGPFLFKNIRIGTSSNYGADSATEKGAELTIH
jgi:hypothetical protein